jgi:uncharacterized protein YjbI with pentapeptide repeats
MIEQIPVNLLKEGKIDEWNPWKSQQVNNRDNLIDLSNIDLSGINLINTDLSYTDLTDANLEGIIIDENTKIYILEKEEQENIAETYESVTKSSINNSITNLSDSDKTIEDLLSEGYQGVSYEL